MASFLRFVSRLSAILLACALLFPASITATENHIFENRQVVKLVPQTPAINGNFGVSVSLSGDYLIVGAPYEEGLGAAYVFH